MCSSDLDQHLAIETDADDCLSGEAFSEPTECLGFAIDDGDGVTGLSQFSPEGRAHSPAPDNDNVHNLLPLLQVSA